MAEIINRNKALAVSPLKAMSGMSVVIATFQTLSGSSSTSVPPAQANA